MLVATVHSRRSPPSVIDAGAEVRLSSPAGSIVLPLEVDDSLDPRVVALFANCESPGSTGASALIDPERAATDVEVERPSDGRPALLRTASTSASSSSCSSRSLVAFGFLLVSVMLMIWFERKVISDMQNRIGPNRAGPFGLLQTLADGTKLFFKEDLIPERADRVVFRLAPMLSLIPAFLIFAIVPVGGVVTIAHHVVELQVADPPIGILFLLALSSIAVYGMMLAGWSSGSKYPLLGSVRASAQMISYEAAMGLTVVTVILESHSLSTRAIVDSQAAHLLAVERAPPRRRPLRHLLHRLDRRAQPAAVRPRRGRVRARWRIPHRVLLDPLRAVLPRRVHEHDHDVGDRRDARSSVARTARASTSSGGCGRSSGSSARRSPSSTSRSGSEPRCRGCATTS